MNAAAGSLCGVTLAGGDDVGRGIRKPRIRLSDLQKGTHTDEDDYDKPRVCPELVETALANGRTSVLALPAATAVAVTCRSTTSGARKIASCAFASAATAAGAW